MIEKSDTSVPRSTLEQWTVLRAVVDTGSFAAAAEMLNRSQSTVSYALARLRDALGVDLLRIEGRRAQLTEQGAILLAEVTPLIADMRRIERRAAAAAKGERLQIRLMVDTLFPRDRLLLAIERFATDSSHVAIDLYEMVRRSVEDGGAEDCDIAIQIAMPGTDQSAIVARVDLIAVASSDHPLALESHAISAATLAGHQRFVIHGFDKFGIHQNSEGRVWHMNTVEAALDAVRRGLCFGWLPQHLIEQDLARGSLVRLALQVPEVRSYALAITSPGAIHRTDPVLARLTALLM